MSTGFQPPPSVWAVGFLQPACLMPIYHPNTRFSDCWGSAGDVTFYHRDGVCYWRSRDRHSFGGTSAQFKALDVHRRALTEQLIKIERIVQMMNARTINAALSFANIFITIKLFLLFVIFNSNYQVNDLNIILSAGRYLVGLQH